MIPVKVRIEAEMTVPMVRSMLHAVSGSGGAGNRSGADDLFAVDPGLQEEILLEAVTIAVRNKLGGFNGGSGIHVRRNHSDGAIETAETLGRSDPKKASSGHSSGKSASAPFVAKVDFDALGESLLALQQDYDRVVGVAEAMIGALPEEGSFSTTACAEAENKATKASDVDDEKAAKEAAAAEEDYGGKSIDENTPAATATRSASKEEMVESTVELLRSGLKQMITDPATRSTAERQHEEDVDPEENPPGLEEVDAGDVNELPSGGAPTSLFANTNPAEGEHHGSSSAGDSDSDSDDEPHGGFKRDYDPAEMGYVRLLDDGEDETNDDETNDDEHAHDDAADGGGGDRPCEGDGAVEY